MTERDMFLRALAENADDLTTRLVFADWLEDHDECEEADRQRKWPTAKRWLENICAEHNATCQEHLRFTYDQLLDFGRSAAALESATVEVTSYLPDCYHIVVAIRDQIPEFWKAWSIVTGLSLPPGVEQKYYYESGYCCATEIYPDTPVAGPIPLEVLQAEEARARTRQQWEDELQQQQEQEQRQREEKAEDLRQQRLEHIQDELEKDRP